VRACQRSRCEMIASAQALAQRVEVADRAVRIIGSKRNLLQTLAAAAKPTMPGVRSFCSEVDTARF
jgi:hypothetical protein